MTRISRTIQLAALVMFMAAAGVPGSAAPLDAAAESTAENAFWIDIMIDHADFFSMLMPGADLASERAKAEEFRRKFQAQGERLKSADLDQSNYAAFNRSTIDLLKQFIAYKRGLLAAQNAGMIRTLIWPLFFDHTAREAEGGVSRLERLSTGDSKLEYSEVVDFWAGLMSDHGQFIAHLLDPQERDLISQALDGSAVFDGFKLANKEKNLRTVELLVATEELVDFNAVTARGIESGAIRSMITPRFADHIRREALRFVDELRRAGGKT
jgi:hypothetical protein